MRGPQYFDEFADKLEKIGNIIGGAISVLVYLSVIALMLFPLMR